MITTATPEIRNIELLNGSTLFIHLTNERIFLVPLEMFPAIQQLSTEERKDFEIIDGTNLSFLAIDEVYSLPELIGISGNYH